MSFEDRLRAVAEAEARCQAHAERARASWHTVKAQAKNLATPWRIVVAGAVLGFLAGRKAKPGQAGVGGKMFAAAAQAIVTAFGAGITAEAGAEFEQALRAGMDVAGKESSPVAETETEPARDAESETSA